MSVINVTVTNAGAANVSVSNGSTVNATVGNGGSVNVSLGTISPGNATVVSGTLTINSTTTLAAGSQAYVKNDAGTAYAAKLDIGIPAGPATNVTVGNTTTLDSGNASVTGVANGSNLTLSFAIPRGAAGINGTTPSFAIGNVTTLSAGGSATVTATPSNGGANVVLDFGLPRGADGTGGGSNLTLSDATPSALGTASAGTSTLASRSDHTHSLPVIAYANLSGVPSNFPTNTTLVSGLNTSYATISHAHNYVTALNNLTGSLTLVPGSSNVTVTANGSTLTIDSSAGGLGANDVVDGGDYIGEILYGITFSTQPQSQTVSSSLTIGSWSNTNYGGAGIAAATSVGNYAALVGASATFNSYTYSWSQGVSQAATSANLSVGVIAYSANGTATSGSNQTVFATFSESYPPAISVDRCAVASNGSAWGGFVSAGGYVYPFSNPNTTNYFSGTRSFLLSANGSLTLSQPPVACTAVCCFNGTYLATNGSSVIRSTDFSSWTTATLLPAQLASSTVSAAAFGGRFFVSGSDNSYVGKIYSSADGVTWSVAKSPLVTEYVGVRRLAASNTSIVCLEESTTSAYVSSDGTTWTKITLPRLCRTIQWTGSMFLAFDGQSTYEFIWSTNGTTWTVGTFPSAALWSQAAGAGSTIYAAKSNDSIGAASVISTTPASANLTVSATAASGNPVSYQWQNSLDAGTSWGNVSNATTSALNLTGLTGSDNGTRYRAIASATGATPATSQSATLTVTG